MTPALLAAYREVLAAHASGDHIRLAAASRVLAAHASGDHIRLAAALREVPEMLGTIALLVDLAAQAVDLRAMVRGLEAYRSAGTIALGLASGHGGRLSDSLGPESWMDIGAEVDRERHRLAANAAAREGLLRRALRRAERERDAAALAERAAIVAWLRTYDETCTHDEVARILAARIERGQHREPE